MFLLIRIIVLGLVITLGATLEIPTKCEIADVECKKVTYIKIFRQAVDGIPKLNIPPADPMIIKNYVSISSNSVKLTLEDGVATGFKNCIVDQFHTYLEEPFHTTVNLTCDLEINGKYKVEVPKSVMKELGGEDLTADVITGYGTGKVILDKLHLRLEVPFDFEWQNKDIYVHPKNVNVYHDAHDTVLFSVADFDVGQKNNGEKISNYLKEHAVELNLLNPVTEKVLEFFNILIDSYITQHPAKDLYTTDLSRYL